MKRAVFCFFTAVVFCMLAGQAMAGDLYDILVDADGKGAPVYRYAGTGTKVGTLYNGYYKEVDWSSGENGFFPLRLTREYTVWIHEKTASENLPDDYWNDPDWRDKAVSGIFLGQLIQDNVPFCLSPDQDAPPAARHQAGTMFIIQGEFGAYYYAADHYYLSAFVPRNAVSVVRELTFREANRMSALPFLEERTVYSADGRDVPVSDSMSGWSLQKRRAVRDGSTVRVLNYPSDGWAQLTDGSFIETRFLTENADHNWYNWAAVKTSSVMNRLNVRNYAGSEADSVVKLCSGVQVQVVSRTEDWAVICLSGTECSQSETGCVMTKYLAFGDTASSVKSGMTEVVLSRDCICLVTQAHSACGGTCDRGRRE